MLMDEQVVMRKEDAEAGMGVIPAHDVEIGKAPVALAGDLFPRIVGVGEAGLGVGVVLGLERLGDPDEGVAGGLVEALLAQQDAAELDGRVGEGVPLDRVGRPVIEEDRQVGRAGNLVGQAGVAPIAVGPEQPLRLAVLDLVEDDLVAAHPLSPQPRAAARSPARRKNRDPDAPSTRTISYAGTPTAANVRPTRGESSSTALTNSGRPAHGSSGRPPPPAAPSCAAA